MGYVRRKQWEARVQAVIALEVQMVVKVGARPATTGPAVTADGERIQRVSTREGLAAILRGQKM